METFTYSQALQTAVAHTPPNLRETDYARPTGLASPKAVKATVESMEYMQYSSHQRMAAARILFGHLLMTEIMMAAISQKYIIHTVNGLKEEGLFRHQLKKQANLLLQNSYNLKARCDAHDRELVENFCSSIWYPLTGKYLEDGGTLTQKMQINFDRTFSNDLSLIYIACKNALDRQRVPHSDIIADAMMVLQLAQTGIELYNYIENRILRIVNGIGECSVTKSRHNELMAGCAREIIRLLRAGSCCDKDASDIRQLVARFQQKLSSQDLLNMIEGSIESMRQDYIEYILANLRINLEKRSLRLSDLRLLRIRMGTFDQVRGFLSELSAIPLRIPPECEDVDIFDVAESLPDSTEGSLLFRFRRLCIEDKVGAPEKEDSRASLCRSLRQQARANGGVLPTVTLKQLYREQGTKRSVDLLLLEAGDELNRTRKVLRKIPVKDLRNR